ncbi:uncharacterized protein BJX67DRAFT_109486 [Aspergillus lucknowensis]|uniref:Uncharacterized protein n=1 Tax=Aspergillus lucknowensis TaxID=176173 RepID=A0ABR4LR21_9EURO
MSPNAELPDEGLMGSSRVVMSVLMLGWRVYLPMHLITAHRSENHSLSHTVKAWSSAWAVSVANLAFRSRTKMSIAERDHFKAIFQASKYRPSLSARLPMPWWRTFHWWESSQRGFQGSLGRLSHMGRNKSDNKLSPRCSAVGGHREKNPRRGQSIVDEGDPSNEWNLELMFATTWVGFRFLGSCIALPTGGRS